MRSFYFIAATLFCTLTARCQVNIGLFAGPQATTAHYTINGIKQSTDYKYGFQLGMNCKIPFDVNLYFAPEIFYDYKGYKVTFTQHAYPPDLTATDNNIGVHTLELAPLLEVDFGKSANHLFVRSGGSLDFQLFGREKFHTLSGDYVNQQMKYGFTDYGRYAMNFIAQLGYESKTGYTLFAQYRLGLTNLSNEDSGPNIRYRVIGISIGKYFNHKKIVIDTRNKE